MWVVRKLLRWVTHSIWPPTVVVVVSLLYLNLHGFPELVCRFVREQFRQNGYIVRFASLRLDWLSGIVAEKLSLADARRPEEPLIRITEVSLQIDWMALLSGRNALRGLRLVNAQISAPMPPDEIGSESFTASDAHATLRFEPGGVIRIEQLTGMYCGIFLYVTGRLALDMRAPTPSLSARTNNFSFISTGLRELHSIRSRKPPDLYLDFEIDLARPMDLDARIRLLGEGVRYRRLAIEQIELEAVVHDGAVRIPRAAAKLAGGELSVSGLYDLARGQTDLSLKSSFDPTVLRPLLPPSLGQAIPPFRLYENPNIFLRYILSPETGPVPVLSGTVQLGAGEFRGVPFRAVSFHFENRGPRITISNAHVAMREGELVGQGTYHIESSDFAYEFESTLDPTRLLPLMTPAMQRWIAPCAFEKPPHITARVRGDFVDPEAFAYDAKVEATACRYREVPLKRVSGSLRLHRNRLEVRDLLLERDDGCLSGELTADFERQQLVFTMRSTANPVPMAVWLGESAAKIMEPYHFGPRLQIAAKGFVDFARPDRTTWSADVADDGFRWWKLVVGHGRGQLQFADNTLQLNLDAAELACGTNCAARARADLQITANTVAASDIVLSIGGGQLRGRALADLQRQQVRFQFDSTANPHILAALLGPGAAKAIEPYQTGSNTLVHAEGIADLVHSNQTFWSATLATDHFAHKDFSTARLNAVVTLTNELLQVKAHAREFNGWNLFAGRLDADLVFSNDILQAQAKAHEARWWKFTADQLDADLVRRNEALTVQARSQGLGWWKLKADHATAELTASNSTVLVRQFNAALCGGTVRGEADLLAAGTNTAFRLQLAADQCNVQRILQSIGSANTNASGSVKLRLNLNGIGGNLATYQGNGTLEIANGVLMEVPLFGIFSQILNLVVPGLGSTAVTSARCTYRIGDERIATDDLQLETVAAAVRSRGSIGLAKGDLDFRVEAQPLRSWPGINILTWMFGKIFEYKVGGTLDNPNWRPTRLPKEILPHSEGKPPAPKPDNP